MPQYVAYESKKDDFYTGGVEWTWDGVGGETCEAAYAKLRKYADRHGYKIHAMEVATHPPYGGNSGSVQRRVKELTDLKIPFPEGFVPPDQNSPVKATKKIELPFEIHNPVKPDPKRCYDAIKAVCEGYRA